MTAGMEASAAVVRLVELSTEQAERLVEESTADAKRIREEANRTAHQLTTADARTRAARVESEARVNAERLNADAHSRAEKLDREIESRRAEMFDDLERRRDHLTAAVGALRELRGGVPHEPHRPLAQGNRDFWSRAARSQTSCRMQYVTRGPQSVAQVTGRKLRPAARG